MDRTEDPQRPRGPGAEHDVGTSDGSSKPEIEPDSWRDLTEFVDQFSDAAVFSVLGDPDDGATGYWIVEDIEKVRPAAVPIDQGPTFDMAVLGPGGEVVGELRLVLDEIEHVRAADPSGVSAEIDET